MHSDELPSVDEAIESLKSALAAAIEGEQLRDQLTDLANGLSLQSYLENEIVKNNNPFWAAFIEVDKFKTINDKYGYDAADELLKVIANQLKTGSKDYFATDVVPFRAHGDEFYIVGEYVSENHDDIARGLDSIRQGIASIKEMVASKGVMTCTVSIGWLTSRSSSVASYRVIQGALELAVTRAKFMGRNRVVEYSDELEEINYVDERLDCDSCNTKFTLLVGREQYNINDPIYCPNCGESQDRPELVENENNNERDI